MKESGRSLERFEVPKSAKQLKGHRPLTLHEPWALRQRGGFEELFNIEAPPVVEAMERTADLPCAFQALEGSELRSRLRTPPVESLQRYMNLL